MQSVTNASLKSFVTSAIVLAGFVICLAADLPGHLSYDSVIQLLEGRTAQYWSWHPPFMSWLLGVFDAVMPGTALFVVFDAALFFGALLALIWLKPQRSWAAAVVAALIAASPIALIYQGIVWKDVLFADLTVAGFVCLAWAAARWPSVALRFALLATSLVLLSLATLARQNGLLMLAMGVVALAWIASRHATASLRALLVYGGGAILFAAVFITAANVALGWRIVGPSGPAKQFRLLQLYDTVGFVAADKSLPLAELRKNAPALEQAIRGDGVRLYNPERNDPLAGSQTLQSALETAPWNAVRSQWLMLVVQHPLLYAKIRLEVFRWIFATPDVRVCLPYLVGISGPEEQMKTLGLAERDDNRDEVLSAYAGAFIRTPVLSHVFYAFVSLWVLVSLLKQRKPEDIAIAALQASALLFVLSFFVIGIACDYRYCYVLDISAMAGALYIFLNPDAYVEAAIALGGDYGLTFPVWGRRRKKSDIGIRWND